MCPQAFPGWILALEGLNASVVAEEPGMTEDCLFLDVVVPEFYIQNATSTAPVMVWVFGGGYVAGSKSNEVAGLISASKKASAQGIIFVALNYRLGLFVCQPFLFSCNSIAWISFFPGMAGGLDIASQRHSKRRPLRPTSCATMGAKIYPPFRRRP